MFQIVALIFIVTNGTPSKEPDDTALNQRQFQTIEACQEFLASDAGKEMQGTLTQSPEFQDGKIMIKFQCQPSEQAGKILGDPRPAK